jgi:hypothetical protein
MRAFLFVFFAGVAAAPTGAAAQTGSEASLVLTIFAGTVTGHTLWTVERQPLSVLGSSPTRYDTLRIVRSTNSSLMLGATGTYFVTPHVGFHVEISYMGLGFDSDCSALFLNPDSSVGGTIDQRRNGQVCDDIQSQGVSGGAISVFGGVTLRAASRGSFSPYVRGNIGFVNLSQTSIDVAGAFVDTDNQVKIRQVVLDQNPRRTSFLLGVAAGFTSPVGPGYQFRLEIRDQIIQFDRLTGPGSAAGANPIARKGYHHFALALGLDVVLERKRGRRY